MSALQASQIFTHEDVKPSGPSSHLGLIMSQENYQSGDEAEASKGDVTGEEGGGRVKGAKATVWRKMK